MRRREVVVSAHARRGGILLLCAIGMVCLQSNGEAQSTPKEFFEKHYADKPLTAGQQRPEYAGREKIGAQSTQRSEFPVSGPAVRDGEKTRQPYTHDAQRAQNGFLTVYVNSSDKGHFERVVENTLNVAEKGRFLVSSVVHIGDYRNVSERVEQDLKSAHISLAAAASPPAYLGLTRSPAWVLYTPQGIHIVEGVVQFDRFMTPIGEFSPQQQVAAAPPTPTPAKMEGF